MPLACQAMKATLTMFAPDVMLGPMKLRRIMVELDEQSERALVECMAKVALERDGEGITITRVVREALMRWAKQDRKR